MTNIDDHNIICYTDQLKRFLKEKKTEIIKKSIQCKIDKWKLLFDT